MQHVCLDDIPRLPPDVVPTPTQARQITASTKRLEDIMHVGWPALEQSLRQSLVRTIQQVVDEARSEKDR
jgi:hypothetical protein